MGIHSPEARVVVLLMDAAQDQAVNHGGADPQADWFQVGLAGDPLPVDDSAALENLLSHFQPLAQNYLCRKHGISPEAAEDQWQNFVLTRVLERQCLSRAHPSRGRFRSFLLTCLDNHVRDELRRHSTGKRSPGTGLLSLHEVPEHEFAVSPPPIEPDSEVVWERVVIAGALLNMRTACLTQGQAQVWEVFEARLLGPILEDTPPVPYETLVGRCDFTSPAQAANALTTAKRMYKRHLRSIIAQYAGDDATIAEELKLFEERLNRST